MALFDDASLVTTPNGYKAGTLYSIKPTSGAGDMTVVRATTATRVNSAGLIESMANNVPRLDYSNGTCPSLLVEPQRSNLVLYSEQFDNAAWTKGNGTITANATTSPDGTANADKFAEDTSTDAHYFGNDTATATSGQSVTFTIFAKASERSWIAIRLYSGASSIFGWYNIGSGTLGTIGAGGTGTIENYSNGWYRCSLTITMASNSVCLPYAFSSTGNGTITFTGTSGSGFFAWGAQLEAGSYPTSYIPTTTAAVTRNADDISKTGISSLIGQTEGTLFFDGIVNNIQNASSNIINTNKNPTTISSFSLIKINATNKINFEQYLGNGTFANIALVSTNAFANGIRTKVAVRYKSGNFAMYINGNLEATSSSTFTNIGVKSELFLNDAVTVFAFQESVSFNSVVLFPNILTNAELASLTTI